MKKFTILVLFLLLLSLSACDRFKEDLDASANSLKSDFTKTKTEIETSIDETKEFYNDVKKAAQEVSEAKKAVESIGD